MKFELFPQSIAQPPPVNQLAPTSTQVLPPTTQAPPAAAHVHPAATQAPHAATQVLPPATHLPTAEIRQQGMHQEKDADQLSSDGSSKGFPMPIDKLKVHGNQLTQQRFSPPQSPHPPSTSATVQDLSDQWSQQATVSSKHPSMLRRYEFIRRSLPRTEKASSPTFVIEGKKVSHKQLLNGDDSIHGLDSFDDSKLDFDPIAYLESKMNPMKGLKPSLPPKPKTDTAQSVKGSNSVVLPVLHIEGPGPGFSHQFLPSKSSSLPGDDQPAEMEDVVTEPQPGQPESIWSELENLDQRHHRAIKKNNFFTTIGTRIGEDHTELCVENSHKSNKTITLHLQTSQEKQRPSTNGFTAVPSTVATNLQLPKTSKSSRDKLYKSATHLQTAGGSRPLFHSVNSYINFNNRRAGGGMYNSEQYLDSSRMDSALKPLENQPKRPFSKKLIAKYSDMEIQRELHDFFKIRPVK